jgi:hypothetical protein
MRLQVASKCFLLLLYCCFTLGYCCFTAALLQEPHSSAAWLSLLRLLLGV